MSPLLWFIARKNTNFMTLHVLFGIVKPKNVFRPILNLPPNDKNIFNIYTKTAKLWKGFGHMQKARVKKL